MKQTFSGGIALPCIAMWAAVLPGCPTRNQEVRTAEGRCALILSQEAQDSAGLGGEASYKGVEVGKGRVDYGQVQVFKVELDQLQQDFNNMSHDLCMDWALGSMTNEQYNESKACLRSTHKKLRILSLGLQSGTIDSSAFMAELQILVDEMDGCEPASVKAPVQGSAPATQQGTSCSSDTQCAAPLYCIIGACRPIGEPGSPCAYDYDCRTPLACMAGSCSQPPQKSTVLDSPCETDDGCQAPLYCILGGCRYLGNVGDGCAYDYDCNAPLACSSGKCAQPAASSGWGTPCTSDTDCTAPLFCILSTCRPLGNPGDGCAADQDCYSPYVCSSGVCSVAGQKGGTAGKPCTSDGDCVEPEYCIVGACRPLSGHGGVCSIDGDCLPGLVCVSGACS